MTGASWADRMRNARGESVAEKPAIEPPMVVVVQSAPQPIIPGQPQFPPPAPIHADAAIAGIPEPAPSPIDIRILAGMTDGLLTQKGKTLWGQIILQFQRFAEDPAGAMKICETMAGGGNTGELFDAAEKARRLSQVAPQYIPAARKYWDAAAVSCRHAGHPERFEMLERLFLDKPFAGAGATKLSFPGRLYESKVAADAGNFAIAAEIARDHLSETMEPEQVIRFRDYLLMLADESDSPDLRFVVEECCVTAATRIFRRKAEADQYQKLAANEAIVTELEKYEYGTLSGRHKLSSKGKKMLEEARRSVQHYAESIDLQVKTMQDKTQEIRAKARLVAARTLKKRGENPDAVAFFFLDEATDREKDLDWVSAWRSACEGENRRLMDVYATVISALRGPAGF